jgi:hypothetical protein
VNGVIRILLLLLSMLTTRRPGYRDASWRLADGPYRETVPSALLTSPRAAGSGGTGPTDGGPGGGRSGTGTRGGSAIPVTSTWPDAPGGPASGGGGDGYRRPLRRRVPRRVKWALVLLAVGLIFRKAVAWAVLLGLSAALQLVGLNVHLPHIRFGWPWQAISAGTTTNTNLGPSVLQKIEGISRPALGRANFNFIFTHKVSKSIGPWPCWYASTFDAVGHASATVDLNPGTTWWAPGLGHYQLNVVSRPHGGNPGRVAVTMVLPAPQLPQSAHDVSIDNLPSKPIATQHSWTYPGFGCGTLLRPQFAESVLYSQAQSIAFYKSTHAPAVTGPLIRTAEAEATQTVRNNFVQPTLNSLGYMLERFSIRWVAGP